MATGGSIFFAKLATGVRRCCNRACKSVEGGARVCDGRVHLLAKLATRVAAALQPRLQKRGGSVGRPYAAGGSIFLRSWLPGCGGVVAALAKAWRVVARRMRRTGPSSCRSWLPGCGGACSRTCKSVEGGTARVCDGRGPSSCEAGYGGGRRRCSRACKSVEGGAPRMRRTGPSSCEAGYGGGGGRCSRACKSVEGVCARMRRAGPSSCEAGYGVLFLAVLPLAAEEIWDLGTFATVARAPGESALVPVVAQPKTTPFLPDTLPRLPGLMAPGGFRGASTRPGLSRAGSGLQSAPMSRGLRLSLEGIPLNFADGSLSPPLDRTALVHGHRPRPNGPCPSRLAEELKVDRGTAGREWGSPKRFFRRGE